MFLLSVRPRIPASIPVSASRHRLVGCICVLAIMVMASSTSFAGGVNEAGAARHQACSTWRVHYICGNCSHSEFRLFGNTSIGNFGLNIENIPEPTREEIESNIDAPEHCEGLMNINVVILRSVVQRQLPALAPLAEQPEQSGSPQAAQRQEREDHGPQLPFAGPLPADDLPLSALWRPLGRDHEQREERKESDGESSDPPTDDYNFLSGEALGGTNAPAAAEPGSAASATAAAGPAARPADTDTQGAQDAGPAGPAGPAPPTPSSQASTLPLTAERSDFMTTCQKCAVEYDLWMCPWNCPDCGFEEPR